MAGFLIRKKDNIIDIDGKSRIIDNDGNVYKTPDSNLLDTVIDLEDLNILGQQNSDGTYIWF